MSRADEIRHWIVENFAPDVSAEDLPYDYDLLDNGVITSLSLVRLVTLLGNRFDIDIDAADLRPDYFRTVTAIDEFVATTLGEQRV